MALNEKFCPKSGGSVFFRNDRIIFQYYIGCRLEHCSFDTEILKNIRRYIADTSNIDNQLDATITVYY